MCLPPERKKQLNGTARTMLPYTRTHMAHRHIHSNDRACMRTCDGHRDYMATRVMRDHGTAERTATVTVSTERITS